VSRTALPLLVALLLAGCPTEDPDVPDPPDPPHEYPLDDALRFHHLQAVGTHNSYHLETGETVVPAWDYSHLPLDEQLGLQGVRQFELDLYRDSHESRFMVLHVPFLDQSTTCAWLTDCLEVMRGWSDRNPGHHPLLTLLETKDGYDPDTAEDYLADLEYEVLDVWPEDRLVTPDSVRGDHATLREALAADGWPVLGELRGKALFVLHDGGGLREVYTHGNTSSEGRVLFPDAQGNTELPYAAVHSMNDPVGGFDAIGAVVAAGHLVRTRADSDSEQAVANDISRRDAALASGAHFISTDYPAPHPDTGYVVAIPDGTPSRCNPLTAPAECSSEAIEDPAIIVP
jgi:hypothetical protein